MPDPINKLEITIKGKPYMGKTLVAKRIANMLSGGSGNYTSVSITETDGAVYQYISGAQAHMTNHVSILLFDE